jgi:hypothetical protein
MKCLKFFDQSAADPRIKGLVILQCVNHILNLVLRNSIAANVEFAGHIRSLRVFQGIMRKNPVIRQYGKVCPDFPDSRWMYVCGVLNWIVTESDELTPFILQCIEDGNEIGDLFAETEFSEGVPAWVAPLQTSLEILEQLSLQFESRKVALWMVVPLLEHARIKLLGNRIRGIVVFEWIQDLLLGLSRRLIARFRTTFNAPAAIAAYLLSNEGRVLSGESPGLAGIPFPVSLSEPLSEHLQPATDIQIYRTESRQYRLDNALFYRGTETE